MAPHERWWLQCLQEGQLRYEEGTGGDRFVTEIAGWPRQIEKDILWPSYKYWVRSHNLRSAWPTTQLHQWLQPLMPGAQNVRPRNGVRKREVILPDLDTCRAAYAEHIGQSPSGRISPTPQPRADGPKPRGNFASAGTRER